MQKLFWLILISFFPFSTQGNALVEKPDTMIIIFELEGVANELSRFELTSDLNQYFSYYLDKKGYEVDFYASTDSKQHNLLKNEHTLIIKSTIQYKNASYTNIDHHRRRTRKPSDSLFMITIDVNSPYQNGIASKKQFRTVTETSNINWLNEPINRSVSNRMQRLTEPREFVMQRAIENVLRDVPAMPQTERSPGKASIPISWYIDSSYIKYNGVNWREQLTKLSRESSRIMQVQFDVSLSDNEPIIVTIPNEEAFSNRATLEAIKTIITPQEEGLIVCLFSRQTVADYFLERTAELAGLAEIGQRLLIVNDVPLPQNSAFWQSYYTSNILVHEIGHAFGAVHVSDRMSVMNHTVTLGSGGRFDRLNRMIINKAISGSLTFGSFSPYVEEVVAAITKTKYTQADIPWFAYHFMFKNDLYKKEKKFYSQPLYEPYYKAAQGYHYMLKRNRSRAAELFSEASSLLPEQGSFYYYLAQTNTELIERQNALVRASQAGYYLAKFRSKFQNSYAR